MKILLTGATGYIGTALRKALKDKGHDVRLFVRTTSAHKIDDGEGFEVVHGDILDTHTCLRATDGVSTIVHLVGILREFPEDGTTYDAMHTSATFNIVDAARRQGAERVIHMSSLGASLDARSRYHQTKAEAEKIVQDSGMRGTIFRPSIVFHKGDLFHEMLNDLVHRPVVPIIDGGKAMIQPVSLENLTAAMAATTTMPETQRNIYEVGGPDRISMAELLEKIARHDNVWMNTMKVSSRMMKPVVGMLQRF